MSRPESIVMFVSIAILLIVCINLYLRIGNLTYRLDQTKSELINVFKKIDEILISHQKDVDELKKEVKDSLRQHEKIKHNE